MNGYFDRGLAYFGTAAATVGAGAFMLAGGYLTGRDGRLAGSLLMLPAGPLISCAFACLPQRRSTRPQPGTRGRRALLLLLGIQVFDGRLLSLRGVGIGALSLLAGTAMAFGGHSLADGQTLLLLPATVVAGAVITTAHLVAVYKR